MGMILNDRLYVENTVLWRNRTYNCHSGRRYMHLRNRGCLETVATEDYILKKCREGLESGVYSEITDYPDLKMGSIIKASNNGDRFVRNIFSEISEYIGAKLTDVANILNPELIILRGSIIDGNSFLYDNIKRVVKNRSLPIIAENIEIAYSNDFSDIRIPGVSSYILMSYFRQ